jgi:hypothetical protein
MLCIEALPAFIILTELLKIFRKIQLYHFLYVTPHSGSSTFNFLFQISIKSIPLVLFPKAGAGIRVLPAGKPQTFLPA